MVIEDTLDKMTLQLLEAQAICNVHIKHINKNSWKKRKVEQKNRANLDF
ncbi:hypothetical protein RBH29_17200 [Herbivorax sp. ANBcel31]|nr:hypothetical protein [Herbivorax sp. ANBcel31]MDQ2088163.1 hypothetical protein [Herbivorax sp. ANBcel31]